MNAEEAVWWRERPLELFQGFARVEDHVTRRLVIPSATVIQRRMFAHYAYCQARRIPCRMVLLKDRRCGGSTGMAWLCFLHSQNYKADVGMLGATYTSAHTLMKMVRTYAAENDFPGWGVSAAAVRGEQRLHRVTLEDGTKKLLTTKIEWKHGSSAELFTAKNPVSARSKGLQCFGATEVAHYPKGGATDGAETINAMLKAVPTESFCVVCEESTATGPSGVFFETCADALWPDYATWWKKWEPIWPQKSAGLSSALRFTLIFAAWFENPKNVLRGVTQADLLADKDGQRQHEVEEKKLMSRYLTTGPRGPRLGDEVEATVWEQLAWRRVCIRDVCKKAGAAEFAWEYPSDPQEAFSASGWNALDADGVLAIEVQARESEARGGPARGALELRKGQARPRFVEARGAEAWCEVWEPPSPGCKYVAACDPMSGAEEITNPGEKDNHSVLVLRDAYTDAEGVWQPVRLVARIVYGCQWEDDLVAERLWMLGEFYGGALLVVESNIGLGILKALKKKQPVNLYYREEWDTAEQKTVSKLGIWMSDASKRVVCGEMQRAIREQTLVAECPHVVHELQTLEIDEHGKFKASGKNHDDDPMALAMGVTCLPWAHEYPRPPAKRERGEYRD